MAIQQITEQTFQQEVLQAELPTVVDLYADWCQPCKVLEPILAEIAHELAGKLKVVRVDIERSPVIAQSFQVQSIPTLLLFHKGRPVDQLVGLADKQALLEWIKPVLPTDASELSPKELASLIAQGRAVPVDIRDSGSYQRYRIPSAIHAQAETIDQHTQELQTTDGRTRVLYSRSTDQAKELAERLLAQGIPVAYLAGGFLHWESEGLEVERGS